MNVGDLVAMHLRDPAEDLFLRQALASPEESDIWGVSPSLTVETPAQGHYGDLGSSFLGSEHYSNWQEWRLQHAPKVSQRLRLLRFRRFLLFSFLSLFLLLLLLFVVVVVVVVIRLTRPARSPLCRFDDFRQVTALAVIHEYAEPTWWGLKFGGFGLLFSKRILYIAWTTVRGTRDKRLLKCCKEVFSRAFQSAGVQLPFRPPEPAKPSVSKP